MPAVPLHGKEGVDGSSPSEGSAKSLHKRLFPFRSTCRCSSVRSIWSRLWSLQVREAPSIDAKPRTFERRCWTNPGYARLEPGSPPASISAYSRRWIVFCSTFAPAAAIAARRGSNAEAVTGIADGDTAQDRGSF